MSGNCMQGVQKLKCTSCGTMFMSESGITTCPTCSENQDGHHHDHESNMGGCGCGHSH
jgi:rubrerythrin